MRKLPEPIRKIIGDLSDTDQVLVGLQLRPLGGARRDRGRSGPHWSLTLYVSGAWPRSAEAIDTVRRICDEDLEGSVDLDVLNAVDHPAG